MAGDWGERCVCSSVIESLASIPGPGSGLAQEVTGRAKGKAMRMRGKGRGWEVPASW